jgi:hypothetical protein
MRCLLLFVILFCSCGKNKNIYPNLRFQIEVSISYRFDLVSRVYTVDFVTHPKNFNFKLTDKEIKEINSEYYLLNLNDLPQDVIVMDKCNIIPKLYTTLFVKSDSTNQIIKIDTNCDNFGYLDGAKATRIKKFILLIEQIVLKKQEPSLASKSSVVYQ